MYLIFIYYDNKKIWVMYFWHYNLWIYKFDFSLVSLSLFLQKCAGKYWSCVSKMCNLHWEISFLYSMKFEELLDISRQSFFYIFSFENVEIEDIRELISFANEVFKRQIHLSGNWRNISCTTLNIMPVK